MGAVRDLWLRWKMLKLPWRKKFLIGQDLAGNTFWEFKDALNHARFRRIVQYNRRTHFSEVKVSPQWHQWLRQTRLDPPTLQEQSADVQRQTTLKYNARLADERWAAKGRYIEPPKAKERLPLLKSVGNQASRASVAKGDEPAVETPTEDPWKKSDENSSHPGSKWEPGTWTPGPAKR